MLEFSLKFLSGNAVWEKKENKWASKVKKQQSARLTHSHAYNKRTLTQIQHNTIHKVVHVELKFFCLHFHNCTKNIKSGKKHKKHATKSCLSFAASSADYFVFDGAYMRLKYYCFFLLLFFKLHRCLCCLCVYALPYVCWQQNSSTEKQQQQQQHRQNPQKYATLEWRC